MTDVTENQTSGEDPELDEMTPAQREQEEKEMLRSRLKLMGISYSNNAGLDALRAKVREALEGHPSGEVVPDEDSGDDQEPAADPEMAPMPTPTTAARTSSNAAPVVKSPSQMSKIELRNHQRAEQLRLVRCRITCMDPKKKEWPGEIITFANEVVGTVSRFVPFGEATDDGWHIEYCLYQLMKDRQFLDIQTRKIKGQIDVKHRLVREFSLEVLEPLTPEELASLGKAQLAAGTSSTL